MNFSGRYPIPAQPQAVFLALHDPEILKACITGCEQVERVSDNEYRAKASIGIGPVRAKFEGKVMLKPEEAPHGFTHAITLSGEGQGGAAGFARGEALVRLSAIEDGTALEYEAKANVGGRLAQLGQRLIDGAARTLADDFFAKFASLMRERAPDIPKPQAPTGPRDENLVPQVWVVGMIGVVILLLILFGIVL